MIAIKLVLQSLTGVTTIVGCLGGSIFISTKTNFEKTNDFYLVTSNSINESEIIRRSQGKDNEVEKKNYK